MDVGGGRWVRGRCLGRGSTAAVYLGASPFGVQEAFAVKSAELSRSAPLRREQTILSSLCSPHIVSCFGSDVTTDPDGRVLYNLFLEFVPGGDLTEISMLHGGLGERTVRLFTRGILDGLVHLHSRGIVHCDVKGQNILLRKDGLGVKLADFGCARWVDGGDDRGSISGTPLYMAPEVARGEGQGPEADIWALGCTVIEMATGCPPWRDVADPVAAIHRIAFSKDVPEFPRTLSDEARDFLGRCLNRDPGKRWSAEELLSHPFLNCGGEFAAGDILHPTRRISPRSILDQFVWDSWEVGDEVEEEAERTTDNQPVEYARERFRQLIGVGVSPPPSANKTWEESCWTTVRDGENSENWIEQEEPCTSSTWFVWADGIGGEESAGGGDGTMVTTGDYLPSYTVNITTMHSCTRLSLGSEGDDDVDTPSCSDLVSPRTRHWPLTVPTMMTWPFPSSRLDQRLVAPR